MENSEHRFLAEAPVGKLMRRYAMPCVISLLVGALYKIVDQIFIANASYLGSFGNAANTVVFPMTVIALAIAVMIGDGCCAFVSLSLGKGRPEDASRSTGNAVVLSVIFLNFPGYARLSAANSFSLSDKGRTSSYASNIFCPVFCFH